MSAKYEDKYPDGVNLDPESEAHQEIVKRIMQYARKARNSVQDKFSTWDKIEDSLSVYVPLDEEEENIQYRDERVPVRVVVPITWATLETLLTYQVSAFFDSPIFKYRGFEPDDTVGAALLEILIDSQVNRFKTPLSLYTMWRDAKIYGFAPVVITWKQIREKRINEVAQMSFSSVMNKVIPFGFKKESIDKVVFEGNSIFNIEPRNYLPDPNVPVNDVQRGRFVGWIERTSKTNLLIEEEVDPDLFNVDRIKEDKSALSTLVTQENPDYSLGGQDAEDVVDVIHMYVKVIPKDWKLGKETIPEKWLISVAGDSVVIKAKKLGLNHDMFPVSIETPTFDNKSAMLTSEMEIIYGLQHTIDWYISSRIQNVKRVVNGVTIFDPYVINENDLRTPDAEKLVRVRRAAFGRGMLREAVFPFPVQDTTSGHMKDVQFLINIVEQVSGAVDLLKGVRRQTSERVSATEAEGVMSAALSRLAKNARIGAWQSHYDIAYMMASHTQQLLSEGRVLKTLGRYQDILYAEYGITTPYKFSVDDIDINYDVVPHDGALPGAESTRAWTQLFQVLISQPEIAQQFDLVRIFQHIARGMGARNVDDFRVKIASQEAIQRGLNQGELQKAGGLPGIEETENTNAYTEFEREGAVEG